MDVVIDGLRVSAFGLLYCLGYWISFAIYDERNWVNQRLNVLHYLKGLAISIVWPIYLGYLLV